MNKLKEAREILGLTQDELAKQWGINVTNISRWENGKCKPLGMFQVKIDALIEQAEQMEILKGLGVVTV